LRAQHRTFSVEGTQLEKVNLFKYLGRFLHYLDSDWPAVYGNLRKARAKWAMIAKVLVREDASPRISGLFYKAVVQTVLLCGCESWVITPRMMKVLEGFHHRVARRLSGKMARLEQGEWVYPPLEEALEDAGLFPLKHYIEKRQQRIAEYVATRPVATHIAMVTRPTGAPSRKTYWWEQQVEEEEEAED
jgi:hypothetical protein